MRKLKRLFRHVAKPLLWLLVIFLGCSLFFGSIALSLDTETHQIGVDEVVNKDVYLSGETVVIDGTVNGNAFLAGNQVTVNGTITNDVYLAGETVTIAGNIGGDAIAAGRQIVVQGNVADDLIAAGRSLIVDGTIGDDARLAGQILQLNHKAQIGDHVVAAGASFATAPQTRIGGSLTLATAQAELSGTVDKDLVGSLGSAQLSGAVNGNTRLIVGAVKPDIGWRDSEYEAVDVPVGLTLDNSAQIKGDLTYEAPQEATISEAAQIDGNLTFREIEPFETPQFLSSAWGIGLVQRFVSLLLVGAILLWWQPEWVQALAANERENPLPSLGWGALGMIAIGIGTVAITAVTILLTALFAIILPGLALPSLGLGAIATLAIAIGFGTFVAFIAQVIFVAWGGEWLMERLGQSGNKRLTALAIGLLLYVLVTAVPVFGSLINFIVSLLGLGALWIWLKTQRSSNPSFPSEGLSQVP